MNRYLFAAAITLALAAPWLSMLPGCSSAQLKADAPALEGVFGALCPLEGMVPLLGPVVASACPAEVASLATLLTGPTPPAPAAVPVQVFRRAAGGLLVHCGTLAAVVAVDAGAPKPSADGGQEAGAR